jgi:hypothetical protein
MGKQVKADLPLDDTVDPQADNGAHRQGGNPCGFLEPHGRDGRGVLDPTKPRFYSGMLGVIGLENLWLRPRLRGHRCGAYRPPLVFLWIPQPLDLNGCNRSLPKALCRQLFILRAFSRFQMDDRHRLGRQVPPMDLLPDSTQLDHPQVQNHLASRNRP